ncbi:hypothetical protein H311_03404 [Anncaliia algerae PRA109]|nr:hypothetical protein H311_03404 [Anncaliia algerae PRA109]
MTLKNVQWKISGVDDSEEKIFFWKLSQIGKYQHYMIYLKKLLKNGILITDVYPSYPKALSDFGSRHIIVNHSERFSNADGHNTNLIENFCSHLKKDYRERAGINKNRIHLFLKEFIWKKKENL